MIEHLAEAELSSCWAIQRYRFVENLIPEIGTQTGRCVQVHFSSQQSRQFLFHREEGQPRDVAALELNEHVDVAIRPEVSAEDRAEERELANVMTPAEIGNLLSCSSSVDSATGLLSFAYQATIIVPCKEKRGYPSFPINVPFARRSDRI
jgi:hypothetical protein